MELLWTLVSWALSAHAVGVSTCCSQLHRELGIKSLQESGLNPACVMRPSVPQDVARAVSVIAGIDSCNFAIKGQGHAPAAGFANIEGSVTIDMTGLNTTTLSPDRSVVRVGAGATWLQVYRYLDPFNIAVAGGRNGLVGVGGLTLGGGISHFSPRVGWACDNVVNFEAFTDILSSSDFDIYTSLVTVFRYNSTSKSWAISNSAVYTRPVLHPPVFAGLATVPSISNSSRITSLAFFADEAPTPPLNWLFATVTLKPSTKFMLEVFDILNSTLYSVNPPGGVVWNIAFEPLPSVMFSQAAKTGGNVLGVRPEDGNSYIMLLSALWQDSAANLVVEQASRRAISSIESRARAKGLLRKFQYLNYAAPYQAPLKSYGAVEFGFLKGVSSKYDPLGLFKDRVPGGFKL
ncbi:uncharacterized protein B0H64DRAFT_416588 [Chaetomium fimeti]|uniref:FAD-binding PCMH-type domain-containing protein n=1 Tax=Chaetomium fimeti TaxID=1854472 RepID=A0AAE0HJU3_9PEZI|nr:hypothetical protein B0H64DRAFT_416588 [Chaetomium fimeti]